MRKFLLLCLLVPIIGMGQTKNVLSVQRMFAKVDKVLEFEKAIGAQRRNTTPTMRNGGFGRSLQDQMQAAIRW